LVITDRAQARRPLTEIAEALFQAGGRWIMLREKDLDPAARRELLRALVALGAPFGATVTVNGDLAAAGACGAAGVHLPTGGDLEAARRALGPDALLGASTHSLDEAQAAAGAGADYVTLSPIFESASKPGYGPALGPAGLAAVATRLPIPVIALGGVVAGNAAACLQAGAAGVAVMGAVMAPGTGGADPGAVTSQLLATLAERNDATGVASGQILR
jgi:thiamine-phosphate pyrophosphorylase